MPWGSRVKVKAGLKGGKLRFYASIPLKIDTKAALDKILPKDMTYDDFIREAIRLYTVSFSEQGRPLQ